MRSGRVATDHNNHWLWQMQCTVRSRKAVPGKLHHERSSNKGWIRQVAEDRDVLRAWSRSGLKKLTMTRQPRDEVSMCPRIHSIRAFSGREILAC